MIRFPWRSKVAAVVVLFFFGTFAGQIQHVLDTVRGKVETGTRITEEMRGTVGQVKDAATNAVDVVADLTNQIADLQAKLAAGTATPDQVFQLRNLVERLRVAGSQGPPGPPGQAGPPGPAVAATPSSTTTSTGGTTTSSRPTPTTTSTRSSPSTTSTTRCAVGVGKLLKVGC